METTFGRFGRLGLWTADHRLAVVLVWLTITLGLGGLAPFADHALSGAGWMAVGSQSDREAKLVDRHFPGQGSYALLAVVRADGGLRSPAARETVARVRRVLEASAAVRRVLPIQAAPDGRTGIIEGLAARGPTGMVDAAESLEKPLAAAAAPGATVRLTGQAAMWADFNTNNKQAMLRSEALSWPLTMVLLVVAFGTLVAAGLPLLLTMAGLASAAGVLFVGAQFMDISIWAMNFALMFAIALGIDYALFVVVRFREALAGGANPREATGVAMETAGKAVFTSGLAVFAALMAVALVPSPTFRTVPLGIALSVGFVLAASLTLLPAVLSKLGPRVDRLPVPRLAHRSLRRRSDGYARWGERIWRRPLLYGAGAAAALALLAAPALTLRTAMPSILVVPEDASSRQGYDLVREAYGPGLLARLQVVAPQSELPGVVAVLRADPGIASIGHAQTSGGMALLPAIPRAAPSTSDLSRTIDRLRSTLPAGAVIGGGAAENHDLERALSSRTPLVYAVVLVIGFLLLLGLLRAPLISAAAVVMNVLATGAALGVGKLVFQDGHLESLLRFQSQGFVDAWAPIFFFALVFALAMDYTVFLLATVKEHFDESGDARGAAIAGLAHTGRMINVAGGVMVVVFLTFALSGPIPPKEMGVVLAVAVLLDATLIRLVLLPVALRLLGAHAWWIPGWLDRILPEVNLGHGGIRETPALEGRRA
ncbi:MAG TPA: MMPL family transporter [Gaiellaceae bacterium]|jgi:RND superfamily putative drug exporter